MRQTDAPADPPRTTPTGTSLDQTTPDQTTPSNPRPPGSTPVAMPSSDASSGAPSTDLDARIRRIVDEALSEGPGHERSGDGDRPQPTGGDDRTLQLDREVRDDRAAHVPAGATGETRDDRSSPHAPDLSPQRAATSAAATFALVFGVAAAICAVLPSLAVLAVGLGVVALALGIAGIALTRSPGVTGRLLAIGGLVLGLVGAALGAVTLLEGPVEGLNDPTTIESLQQQIDDAGAEVDQALGG